MIPLDKTPLSTVRPMKIFLTILSSLFFICALSHPISAEGDEKKKSEKEDKEEKEEESGKKNGGTTVENSVFRSYLDVGTMTIPIIKRDKVHAYIRMKIQIMTKDGSYKKRLHDAYFSDIYGVMSDRWLPPKEPTSEVIQKRLAKQTQRIVGSDQLLTILPTYYFYKVPERQVGK
jgi:hypothetical protein